MRQDILARLILASASVRFPNGTERWTSGVISETYAYEIAGTSGLNGEVTVTEMN